MTIKSRIRRLEHTDEFSTKPVRGIMYICDELPAHTYTLTVGEHTELIERHQGESQADFDNRAHATMGSHCQGDRNAPVAFLRPLLPEILGESHDTQ
jgi:hypothetical protein